MSYANPITFDLATGGLKGTSTAGTYKAYSYPQTLSWTADNVQSLGMVFGLMQSDIQRAFDSEQPGAAERVATDWRTLLSKVEAYGSMNPMMVTELYNEVNLVLKRGYEQLGQPLPAGSSTKTPESAQQPGIIYTPIVQPIPSEMLEPPVAPAPKSGAVPPPKVTTINVAQQQPPAMPSGPGGGIVQAQPAEGIPWKWIALGLGALFLLKGRGR